MSLGLLIYEGLSLGHITSVMSADREEERTNDLVLLYSVRRWGEEESAKRPEEQPLSKGKPRE